MKVVFTHPFLLKYLTNVWKLTQFIMIFHLTEDVWRGIRLKSKWF